MYLERMGFRVIGQILKVSNVTVLNWIRGFRQSVKAYVLEQIPADIRYIDVIEIDEIRHFTKKKTKIMGLDYNQ